MADKIAKVARKARLDMWNHFKTGINMKGYEYYQPPDEVMYRYPAPGSCALDENDHQNLYNEDWKTPFRQSVYNISKIEIIRDDDDPRQA